MLRMRGICYFAKHQLQLRQHMDTTVSCMYIVHTQWKFVCVSVYDRVSFSSRIQRNQEKHIHRQTRRCVRVFDVNMDTFDTILLDSPKSSITIEISEGTEMIELDASCEAEVISLDDESLVCNTKNPAHVDPVEHASSSETDTEPMKITIHSRRDSQLAQSSCVAPKPVFKVMFRDENVSRQYQKQVKDFLHALVRSKPRRKKGSKDSSLTLEIWDDEVDSKDEEVFVGNESALNDSDGDFLFTIDKQPNVKDNWDIPTYGQKYKNTFEKSNHETSKDFVPKLNCFNCNGNHNLRDCPLPKNQSNINKNRKEFATKYTAGVRYHMSEDQRFSHMIPGQLSHKLRKALGLKDNELPRHIYRMRLLGYPPGWLEEARLQYSGLSLFNSDGIAESDMIKEEGEIIMDADRDRYDIKKIYDFPGFNVLPPPGTVDDSQKYWVPQIQSMHSKEMMLLHLQGKEADEGYKRKKLKLPPPIMNNVEISDMEIEDTEENNMEDVSVNGHFIPPLPKEPMKVPPPPAKSTQVTDDSLQMQELSFNSADDTTSSINSPSLSELERKKKVLLMEIEKTKSRSNFDSIIKNDLNTSLVSDTSFSSITPSTSRRSSQNYVRSDLQSSDTSFKNDMNTSVSWNTSFSDKTPQSNSTPIRSTPHRSSDTSQASIRSVHLGTPILPSTSPYNKLPSSEKFSKDICDVINFENLPDSTGKYEQMSGVLQKVRSTMTRLQQE